MGPTPRLARLAVLPAAFALACLGGCNSKSDNPAATNGTGVTQEDISVSAAGALDFVNGLVSEVQPLSQGDFSGVPLQLNVTGLDARGGPGWPHSALARLLDSGPQRSQPEVVWVPEDQSWVLDAHQTDTSENGTATLDLHFAVQYFTGAGTAQQLPDGDTVTMTVDVSMAVDLAGSSDGEVFDLSLAYDTSMSVTGLINGPCAVDGGGSLDMSLLWSGPSTGGVNATIGMDWLMDVDVPLDGSCPSGVVTMNVDTSEADQYSFVGTYDGTPSARWTLYESGAAIDSGTEAMACTSPAL